MSQHTFHIKSKTAPVVELDPEAMAAYVRFKDTKVAKTLDQPAENMHIAIDLDSANEVVGIEAVGFTEFSLSFLLKQVNIPRRNVDFEGMTIRPTVAMA